LARLFLALIVMMAVIAGLSINALGTLNSAISDVIAGPSARLALAQQTSISMSQLVRYEKNMALTDDLGLTREWNTKSDTITRTVSEQLDKGMQTATEDARPLWSRAQEQWTKLKDANQRMRALAMQNLNDAAAKISINEGRAAAVDMERTLNEIVDSQTKAMQETDASTNTLYASVRTTVVVVTGLALLMAVAGAVWIGRMVSRGLTQINTAVRTVSEGDLDHLVEIKGNDEIAEVMRGVNAMIENLRKTAELADEIASGDLGSQVQLLSDRDRLGKALTAMMSNLRAAASVADRLAEGDLTVNHTASSDRDRLGQALVSMIKRLREVVSDRPPRPKTSRPAASNSPPVRNSFHKGQPNKPLRPNRPPRRWNRWLPTSSRTPTMRPRPKRSRASRPRMRKARARWSTARWMPCAPSRKRSASSRKSPVRPTCSRSTPQWKPRARASTARALPWWRARCASWPSAARALHRKSLPSRPTRSRRLPKLATCWPSWCPTFAAPPN
jgi:HAMP domain-containing protein